MSQADAINLHVNGKSLTFNVSIEDFNNYQNDCLSQQTGMVDASHNFLTRTVASEHNDTLQDFLKHHAGAAVDICGAVIKEYKKPLNITVGKLKALPVA